MELKNIVGVWRLASTRATDPDGKPAGQPFGLRGMGLVTFTSDGRMMSVLVDGRASLLEGTPRQYSSYCGNYTFDGSTLTTVVDASTLRGEDDRLVLTSRLCQHRDGGRLRGGRCCTGGAAQRPATGSPRGQVWTASASS